MTGAAALPAVREDPRVPAPIRPNTAPAVEAIQRNAAQRAIDDPVKLARAARIIRTALARQRITLDELTRADAGRSA